MVRFHEGPVEVFKSLGLRCRKTTTDFLMGWIFKLMTKINSKFRKNDQHSARI